MKGFKFLFSMLLVMMFTLNVVYAAPDIGKYHKNLSTISDNGFNYDFNVQLAPVNHFNLINGHFDPGLMFCINEYNYTNTRLLIRLNRIQYYNRNVKLNTVIKRTKLNTNTYKVMYRCKEKNIQLA